MSDRAAIASGLAEAADIDEPKSPRCAHCGGPVCVARCEDHPETRYTDGRWTCSAVCWDGDADAADEAWLARPLTEAEERAIDEALRGDVWWPL